MTDYYLPYGKQDVSITIPNGLMVDMIKPRLSIGVSDPLKEVSYALNHPINEWKLSKFKGAKSAAIAVNDKTRPVPNKYLLPPLLSELEILGISPDNIKLIIAPGTHKPMDSLEYEEVLPKEVIRRYHILCHNARDEDSLIYLGTTKNGTPVWINQIFYDADLKITVGNVEPHHFMGFSGGVKSPAIGLAGMKTINTNHTLMKHSDARLGNYSNNPVRIDVEEIGKMIGVHFCLNAILNTDTDIVHVLAGHPVDVMAPGIKLVREVFEVPIKGLYDLVIASPGGYPRDINLVQSEKGLSHAALITRDGGFLFLIAECSEGTGSAAYEKWMENVHSHDQVIERFENEELTVGPHKAYQIAQYGRRVNIFLSSNINNGLSQNLLLPKVVDLQKLIHEKIKTIGNRVHIAIMPQANTTIPKLN